jgi:uncharacterized protein YgbK (DUF1537 family)
VAAPALGRYCVFGNLFARFGIGSNGAIYRLDRHPSISRHPVTPMTEADLRVHLSKQTRKRIGLFDILSVDQPRTSALAELNRIVREGSEIVLFDALYQRQLEGIGALIDAGARRNKPVFSVGSSGVEMALAAHWKASGLLRRGAPAMRPVRRASSVLVGSGSCSPITSAQIEWALKHGFAEVPLNVNQLLSKNAAQREIRRAVGMAANLLQSGRDIIVHTTRRGSNARVAASLKGASAQVLGGALGAALRETMAQVRPGRLCIAGGDTSSFAARAQGIAAVEMIAPLTPGAPLCRAHAPGSPADGMEVVFKGGQVGPEDYFNIVKRGRI